MNLPRTHSTFSELMILFVGVSNFGKIDHALILEVRQMAPTAVTWVDCLSQMRSLTSSLTSNMTLLLHTELARQSAFWNGRQLISFHQICGSQKSRRELDWLQNLRKNAAAALPAKSSWCGWIMMQRMLCLVHSLEQSVINDAINGWHKSLSAIILANGEYRSN